MGTLIDSQQTLLTYADVKEAHPTWGDIEIEDYLSLKRDVDDVAEIGDNSESARFPYSAAFEERLEELEAKADLASIIRNLEERVEDLEQLISSPAISRNEFETINIAPGVTAFSATGKQIIICNNTGSLDLTLNASPDDAEDIHVKRNAVGAVNFIGSIDGFTNNSIASIGDGIHLIYTIDQGEWGAS